MVAAAVSVSSSTGVSAQAQDDAAFQSYLNGLWPQAQAMGISRATFDRIVPTLTYNPRVVQLDRSQLDEVPTNPNQPIAPFAPYRARHVDAARINGGRAVLARVGPQLAAIERREGVPAGVVLGIFGHETNYGGLPAISICCVHSRRSLMTGVGAICSRRNSSPPC